MFKVPEEGRRILAIFEWGEPAIGMRVGTTFCTLHFTKEGYVEYCHADYMMFAVSKWAYIEDVNKECKKIWNERKLNG